MPMTSSERMAARAAQRMVYGPSVADRLADEIAADMCHCGVEKWATFATQGVAVTARACTYTPRPASYGIACMA